MGCIGSASLGGFAPVGLEGLVQAAKEQVVMSLCAYGWDSTCPKLTECWGCSNISVPLSAAHGVNCENEPKRYRVLRTTP